MSMLSHPSKNYFHIINKIILFCSLLVLACHRPSAQRLKQIKIELGAHSLMVEIAATEKERQRGLMFRKQLAANAGMLFVFPYPRQANFWMKNTLIPLDIGYFRSNKRMLEYMTMLPDDGAKTYTSSKAILYALETNAGWFSNRQIPKGALLKFPPGIEIIGK